MIWAALVRVLARRPPANQGDLLVASQTPSASYGRVAGPRPDDLAKDIERIVQANLAEPSDRAMTQIDSEIASAVREARWRDAVMWQRVRLRIRKAQLGQPGDREAPIGRR